MIGERRRHVRLVMSRELLDYRRQRKVWRRLFVQPFVIVVLLAVPALLLRQAERSDRERTFTVGLQGNSGAVPGLRAALDRAPLDVRSVDDAESAVVTEAVDSAVVVPDAASDLLRRGEPVPLQVLVLPGDNSSRLATAPLQRRLAELRADRARAAISKQGLPATIATPFAFDVVDLAVSTPEGTRFGLAQALPSLLAIQLLGLMAAAQERLAGAKDRRVLEPLLVLPFQRLDILVGIGGATMLAGLMAAALLFVPLAVGLSVAVGAVSRTVAGPLEVAMALLFGIVVLGVFFTGVGLYAGARAHSGGEGTVFVTVAQVAVFALVTATPFLSDISAEGPLLLVPLLGPMLVVRDAISSGFDPRTTVVAIAGVVAAATILLRRAVKHLDADTSVLRPSTR